MLEAFILAIVTFVSTNLDKAFLLVAFFCDPRLRTSYVVVGQYLGMAALTAAALVLALLALAIPESYIGLLGLLPIAIGLGRLWSLWSGAGDEGDAVLLRPGSAVTAVAVVTIANGGDNIAVYVPLFADRGVMEILLICTVFAVMTAVWCLAGKALLLHPTMGKGIQTWGHRAMPVVLVALGVYIMVESGLLRGSIL